MKKLLGIMVLGLLLSGCGKNQETEYKFTCEGSSKRSYADLGLGPEHDDKEMFIDEYNLNKIEGGEFILQMDKTNVNPRPFQITETNGHLSVSNSSIKFSPQPPFYVTSGDITILSYNGMISLNSGNFSATLITKFRGSRVPTTFRGQCFGLEEIKKYINR